MVSALPRTSKLAGVISSFRRLRPTTVGVIAVAVAAGLWGTDALLRRPLAQSTQAATIVFGEHLVLVALSLLPALLVGLPLGRWAFRSERARGWSFALLNIFQTTPSVALFAFLMVPLTALADAESSPGIRTRIPVWAIRAATAAPARGVSSLASSTRSTASSIPAKRKGL